MSKPFLNLDEIENFEKTEKGHFGHMYAPIGEIIGAQLLGYNLCIVPPGKRVCPFHNHRVNEELFIVLDGEGTLRFGDKEYSIKKHDIIACPPGGPEVAHQIVNTSDKDIKYLALSTNQPVEICEYPDSNKTLSMTGPHGARDFRLITKKEDAVDYYEGEL